jgi:hypothetical protein
MSPGAWQYRLEGFRIEGRRNSVSADLDGDVAESDRLLISVQKGARRLGERARLLCAHGLRRDGSSSSGRGKSVESLR